MQNQLALVLVHVLAPLLVVVLMVVRCGSHDTWAWSKALQHVVAVVPQVVVDVLYVAAAALTQVVAATLPQVAVVAAAYYHAILQLAAAVAYEFLAAAVV